MPSGRAAAFQGPGLGRKEQIRGEGWVSLWVRLCELHCQRLLLKDGSLEMAGFWGKCWLFSILQALLRAGQTPVSKAGSDQRCHSRGRRCPSLALGEARKRMQSEPGVGPAGKVIGCVCDTSGPRRCHVPSCHPEQTGTHLGSGFVTAAEALGHVLASQLVVHPPTCWPPRCGTVYRLSGDMAWTKPTPRPSALGPG